MVALRQLYQTVKLLFATGACYTCYSCYACYTCYVCYALDTIQLLYYRHQFRYTKRQIYLKESVFMGTI